MHNCVSKPELLQSLKWGYAFLNLAPDKDNEKVNYMLALRQYQRFHMLVARAPHLLQDVPSKPVNQVI